MPRNWGGYIICQYIMTLWGNFRVIPKNRYYLWDFSCRNEREQSIDIICGYLLDELNISLKKRIKKKKISNINTFFTKNQSFDLTLMFWMYSPCLSIRKNKESTTQWKLFDVSAKSGLDGSLINRTILFRSSLVTFVNSIKKFFSPL